MKVANFEGFDKMLFEKKGPTGPPAQNTPSKSGINYKENINYKGRDTGKSSSDNYVRFAIHAIDTINYMATQLLSYGKCMDIAKAGIGRLRAKISQKPTTYEIHESYWEDVKKVASDVYAEGEQNAPGTGDKQNMLTIYNEEMQKLKDEAKKRTSQQGKITKTIGHAEKQNLDNSDSDYENDEIYKKGVSDLKLALNNEIGKSNIIVYNDKMRAANYYKAAVFTFAQGALIELSNMEDNAQEYKEHLETATEKLSELR
jgi:hypothetical protein